MFRCCGLGQPKPSKKPGINYRFCIIDFLAEIYSLRSSGYWRFLRNGMNEWTGTGLDFPIAVECFTDRVAYADYRN
jgi:hypothetical protein